MTRTGGKTTRVDYQQPDCAGAATEFRNHDLVAPVVPGIPHRSRDRNRLGSPLQEPTGCPAADLRARNVAPVGDAVVGRFQLPAPRFKGIARRFFGHTQSTHQLPTRTEIAQHRFGIVPGQWVRFEFEGRHLRGFVNRIGQRATILVEHPGGDPYSDGRKYRKYYVPLNRLQKLPLSGHDPRRP